MTNEYLLKIMKDIKATAPDILHSENFIQSDNNMQHGNISVMKHSKKVACTALAISRKLKLKCDETAIMRGALLHDYFLYDWHTPEHAGFKNLHGFFHPGIALKNAEKEYDLSERERDIIQKHMWPLTLVPPKFKESWVVTLADKYVSTTESFHFIKAAKARKEKYAPSKEPIRIRRKEKYVTLHRMS